MDLSYGTFQKSRQLDKSLDTPVSSNTPVVSKTKSTLDLSYSSFQKSRQEETKTQPVKAELPPQQSLLKKGEKLVTDNFGTSEDLSKSIFNFPGKVISAVTHSIDTAKKVISKFTDPFMAGIEKEATGVGKIVKGDIPNKIAGVADLVSGVATSFFSPVSGAFSLAQEVPGLKQATDVLNVPLTATGFIGSFASGKAIDILPISQETKDIIKPSIQEVGSLASQVLLGGKILGKISEYAKTGKEITPKIAKEIIDSSKKEVVAEHYAKLHPGEEEFINFNKEGGFEKMDAEIAQMESDFQKSGGMEKTNYGGDMEVGYQDFQKLLKNPKIIKSRDVINAGDVDTFKKIIQEKGLANDKSLSNMFSDFTGEKTDAEIYQMFHDRLEKERPETLYSKKTVENLGLKGQKTKPLSYEQFKTETANPTATTIPPVESKVGSEGISRVYDRLKNEVPDALKEDVAYDPIKLKEDAVKAVDLIAKDVEKAYKVAMEFEEAPKGQTATAVNIALAEKSLVDGNYDLYSRLVKNRSLAQTRRGQEIVAEKGSVTDNSTSRYVKELISARLDTLGNQYASLFDKLKKSTSKEKAIKSIDREVKRTVEKLKGKDLDIREAQSLIDSLIC